MKIKHLSVLMIIILSLLTACGSQENVQQDTAPNTPDNDSSITEVSWPNSNVELYVPYGEGGSVDRLARGLAAHWEQRVGQQMIVQNRGGASGLLGAESFLGAKDDGHSLFVGLQPTLSMNMLVQDADFSLDDFKFINIEQRDFGSITVRKDSPYETIDDLIEDAQKRPGELTMSVAAGAGTSLFGYAFIDALGLDVNIVTFDSGGEQRTDLLGGHSDFAASGAYGDLAIQDEVRVLTVGSEEPFPGWEDAPPINEVLAKYTDETMPPIGDNRFIAVHNSFAEENPEVFDYIVESYRENYESEEYQNYIKEQEAESISYYYGPEESLQIMEDLHEVVERYADLLRGAVE